MTALWRSATSSGHLHRQACGRLTLSLTRQQIVKSPARHVAASGVFPKIHLDHPACCSCLLLVPCLPLVCLGFAPNDGSQPSTEKRMQANVGACQITIPHHHTYHASDARWTSACLPDHSPTITHHASEALPAGPLPACRMLDCGHQTRGREVHGGAGKAALSPGPCRWWEWLWHQRSGWPQRQPEGEAQGHHQGHVTGPGGAGHRGAPASHSQLRACRCCVNSPCMVCSALHHRHHHDTTAPSLGCSNIRCQSHTLTRGWAGTWLGGQVTKGGTGGSCQGHLEHMQRSS